MHARQVGIDSAGRLIGLLCLTALAIAPAAAADTLTPHTAEYKVKVRVVGGQLTTELRQVGDGFVATHVIRPTGMSRLLAHGELAETSEFYEAGDGIRPARYHTVDTISRDREQIDVSFDWDSGEARGTVNGSEVVADLPNLAHDRVSIQYELMDDLLNERSRSEYTLFDVDGLRPVTVRNIGRKTVEVPAGTFEVVGIQHQTERSRRVTTLWCAEELGYLPVVIEQHRRGELRVRATLSRYVPATAATSTQ